MTDHGENTIYLYRLWDIYRFLAKFLVRFICHGRLATTVDSKKRLLTLKEKLTDSKSTIAHRGSRPEHTLTGFLNCVEHGISVMEIDLNFTSDGHLVAFHDYTVDRTSNGTGLLGDMTLAQAKLLDVGIKYGFPNDRIPTLLETVSFAKENNMFIFLDVKGTVEKTIPSLVALFKNDPWLIDNTAVISFFPDIIYYFKLQFPQAYTGISCAYNEFSNEHPSGRPMFPSSPWKQTMASIASRTFHFLLLNWVWWAMGVSILLPSYNDILNRRFPHQYYVNRNVLVVPWTINDQTVKQHIQNVLKLPLLTDTIP